MALQDALAIFVTGGIHGALRIHERRTIARTVTAAMDSMMKGQTAIVTGGARGIGLGIVQRLAREGCRVVVWDRDIEGFDAERAGVARADVHVVDVARYESVQSALSATLASAEGVAILVNNAGINGPVVPAWEYPIDAWDRVLAIDLTAVFYCCRALVPVMRKAGYGRIINIASIAGKEGGPGIIAYAASKAGVIGFTKTLARELVDSGVLVNAVAPVITETELFKQMTPEHIAAMKAKIPMGRFLSIDEIAALVAWIASPECSFTTGFTFDVSGGRATY
jgi:3-oxoacyl-[acyl-carrier protein] reductase